MKEADSSITLAGRVSQVKHSCTIIIMIFLWLSLSCNVLQEPPPVPQSPPPGSEDEVEHSTDEDLSGDLLQVNIAKVTYCIPV